MKLSPRIVPPICFRAAVTLMGWLPASRRPLAGKSLALLGALIIGNILAAPPSAQAQDTGAVTPFVNVGSPTSGLVKGPDGNFYGTTGGFNVGYGEVYRVTTDGQVSAVYQFQAGDDGYGPSNLIVGSDGNLYGTAIAGPTGDGLVFRLTTGGTFTVLHDFSKSVDGSGPKSIVQAGDGTFYGITGSGGESNGGYGTLYNLTQAGKVTVVHVFTDGERTNPTTLIAGRDGNFYGTTAGYYPTVVVPSLPSYGGSFFQVTPAGVYTELFTFPVIPGGEGPNSLIQTADGNFYGTMAGDYYQYANVPGTVFRTSTAGDVTTLHQFDGTDGYGPIGLIQGSDGNFYGVTNTGGLDNSSTDYHHPGNGTTFQITPAGDFTSLYSFIASTGISRPNGPLIEISEGTFYGTANAGVVYDLTLIHHPEFFAGQAPLADSVYYLAFASGTPFGYYSFLTDPAYIYHFDLGYEYVIDANDGYGDLYLYDFASGGFFYTGPQFPFPYLYDFNLKSIVYYFPDPDNAGHYNIYGTRYFYNFATDQIVAK